MAGLNWPIKVRFVSYQVDPIGTGVLLRVQIVDNTAAVRKDMVVSVNKNAPMSEVLSIVREQADVAMVSVAGTRGALLDALIASGALFDV